MSQNEDGTTKMFHRGPRPTYVLQRYQGGTWATKLGRLTVIASTIVKYGCLITEALTYQARDKTPSINLEVA